MKTSAKRMTVVVLGAMNPAIHYPLWYAEDDGWENEFSESIARAKIMMLPQLTTFESRHFQIQCTSDSWKASTAHPVQFQRVIELTQRVFSRLQETPTNAFGLNLDFEGQMKAGTAGVTRARENLCAPPELGLTRFVLESGTREAIAGGMRTLRTFNVTVSVDEGLGRISINADHQIPIDNNQRRFDFAQVLQESLDAVDLAQIIADQLLVTEKDTTA